MIMTAVEDVELLEIQEIAVITGDVSPEQRNVYTRFKQS